MENRKSKDDKVFRRMWEVVETEVGRIGVVEVERRRKKKGRRRKTRRGRKDEEREQDNRYEESSRRVGNLEWGRKSCKIRKRGKEISIVTIPQVDQSVQKKNKWEDVNEDDMESCNRVKEGVCTKKREI